MPRASIIYSFYVLTERIRRETNPAMKRPLIKCSCCNGRGKTELSTTLFVVLQVTTKSWQSTKDIYALVLPVSDWLKVTALNNRLVELQKLGLIDCEQRGKAKFWKLHQK